MKQFCYLIVAVALLGSGVLTVKATSQGSQKFTQLQRQPDGTLAISLSNALQSTNDHGIVTYWAT